MMLCGEADNARRAFELIRTRSPHLVITGLSLKDSHGLEFIKDLHVQQPDVPVLVFSMYDESIYAERTIRAGASGFLTKRRPTCELLDAVRRILAGEIYLSEQITAGCLGRFFGHRSTASAAQFSTLTDRELEVFELIGHGHTTRQIALALHLDTKTVETYRFRIKLKLGLDSASALAQHAQQWVQQTTSGPQSSLQGKSL